MPLQGPALLPHFKLPAVTFWLASSHFPKADPGLRACHASAPAGSVGSDLCLSWVLPSWPCPPVAPGDPSCSRSPVSLGQPGPCCFLANVGLHPQGTRARLALTQNLRCSAVPSFMTVYCGNSQECRGGSEARKEKHPFQRSLYCQCGGNGTSYKWTRAALPADSTPGLCGRPLWVRSLRVPWRASRKLVCFPDGNTSPPHRPLLGGELAPQAPDCPPFETLDSPTSQR